MRSDAETGWAARALRFHLRILVRLVRFDLRVSRLRAVAVDQIAEPLHHDPRWKIGEGKKFSGNNVAVRVQARGEGFVAEIRFIGCCHETFVSPHRIRNAPGFDYAHSQSSARLIVAAHNDGRAATHSERARGLGVQLSGDRSRRNWQRKLAFRQFRRIQDVIGPAISSHIKREESRSQ